MSSREIAELTGKRHPDVKRDIENMLDQLGEDVSKFARIYSDSMNRQQTEYLLPKDETITLVAGYSVVLRHRIVKRWQELEAQAAATPAIPTNYAEALRVAADEYERRLAAETALEEAKPLIQLGGKVEKIKHTLARAARSYEGVNSLFSRAPLVSY